MASEFDRILGYANKGLRLFDRGSNSIRRGVDNWGRMGQVDPRRRDADESRYIYQDQRNWGNAEREAYRRESIDREAQARGYNPRSERGFRQGGGSGSYGQSSGESYNPLVDHGLANDGSIDRGDQMWMAFNNLARSDMALAKQMAGVLHQNYDLPHDMHSGNLAAKHHAVGEALGDYLSRAGINPASVGTNPNNLVQAFDAAHQRHSQQQQPRYGNPIPLTPQGQSHGQPLSLQGDEGPAFKAYASLNGANQDMMRKNLVKFGHLTPEAAQRNQPEDVAPALAKFLNENGFKGQTIRTDGSGASQMFAQATVNTMQRTDEQGHGTKTAAAPKRTQPAKTAQAPATASDEVRAFQQAAMALDEHMTMDVRGKLSAHGGRPDDGIAGRNTKAVRQAVISELRSKGMEVADNAGYGELAHKTQEYAASLSTASAKGTSAPAIPPGPQKDAQNHQQPPADGAPLNAHADWAKARADRLQQSQQQPAEGAQSSSLVTPDLKAALESAQVTSSMQGGEHVALNAELGQPTQGLNVAKLQAPKINIG